jgi:PAS domain S-box-containing protein
MSRLHFKKPSLLELFVLIFSALALAARAFHLELLNGVKPGIILSGEAAITFIVAIVSKIFFTYSKTNKRFELPSKALALFVSLIGVIRLLTIIFGHYRSTDMMSLLTAFNFVFTGVALFYLHINNTEKIFLPHVLSVITFFIALLSGIAGSFDNNTFYGIEYYQPMTIMAAINFMLLSFSMLLVNRQRGFMGEFTSEYAGGKIARLFLPFAIAVPVILTFIRFKNEETGFLSTPVGVAFITLFRITILILFIWRCVVIVNRSNKDVMLEIEERKKTEANLRYRKALLEAQNEAIPDAILVVDTKGKMLFSNNNFNLLWGIPEDIITAKNDTAALNYAMTQLIEPDAFIDRINFIYSNPEIPSHDEILFKDGRIIERFGNIVVGDDGTQYGLAWYFRDITLSRNYENKIKNFNKSLEIKVEERTEELHKHHNRFRMLVENSSDIISLVDFEGRITYISPSVKRLTGFSEEEILGRSGFDLIHPKDVEGGKNFRSFLLDTPGIPSTSTFRLRHKNGNYIWVEGTVTNMLDEKDVNAFVLNYHDITDRKLSEQKIIKSEKRFRSLVENAQDIISLSDEKGIRFYVSPSIEKITGYTIKETLNQSIFDLVHPDDIESIKNLREQFMSEPGVIKPLSVRYLHKDGRMVWIEGTIVNLLHNENVKAVLANYQDVTERKKSEEKIRLSNERFEMVSKATNDAVWDWNLNTDKIYWNDEIRSMFNYCAEDIPNGNVWKVHIHPEDFKRVSRKLVYHIKNEIQNWQDEYRFRCADGSYRYVFNRGFILFDTKNKPYRIIGAMQDVTEINKLQQSLNEERIKKQKELTNATILGQEKERTEIGRELHDNINQLLTAIKLYLNAASAQPSIKDEMIKRSIENLSKCIEEIRKLSSSLVPPSIDADSFTEVIKELAEPIKLATSLNIIYNIDNAKTTALTDLQQLNIYRIIQEHLNNILKHANAKNVSINMLHEDDQIILSIKDDGQGFDISARRHGIGFKNIQSRAELLNGKMKVLSKPGNGCLLVVNFPVNTIDSLK